jgi:hypothetical protein
MVTVYCVLKGPCATYNGVIYRPYFLWTPLNKYDITIIWRDPSNCMIPINSSKIFLDLHDAIDPKWLNDIS